MKTKTFLATVFVLLAMVSSLLSPTIFAYEAYAASKTEAETNVPEALPDAYCMRDEYIVLAQNQDVHGYCWNFAATMAASTTIMKATGEYYDFSELWTGISAYQTKSYSKLGAGGSISTQYNAMKTAGLMLECDLPYQESYITSNQNAKDYYNFFAKYASDELAECLTQSSYLNYKQGNVEDIKRHLMENGSLYLAFSFHQGYIIDEVSSYLPPNQKNTTSSHAVSLIGWDDNYTKEVITDGSDTPTVFKGAWMILNSYTETNGKDGISYVFYEDNNISQIAGYEYQTNTEQDFYFYDKIESGYAYPTNVKGKYHGNYKAETAKTKQKNIFYDDVNLTYSYISPDNVRITDIDIYLGNQNVTHQFATDVSNKNKTFSISRKNADYGQYKVLVTYSNGIETDTYLNNFYVTYGLFGESLEIDTAKNSFSISPGRDLEFYSFTAPTKDYVIYTNQTSGTLSFCALPQSVYSEQNMALPTLSYKITDGKSCTVTHTITSKTGYDLTYTFHFVYFTDNELQPVNVYYDLGGGQNHSENYARELASPTTDLALYAPTREGYTFAGWYVDYGHGSTKLREENGIYYIDWEDIHHLGENPGLNALSHYQKYYNNSSTVFVYARWAEESYYTVELSIVGNGSSSLGEKVVMRQEDVLHYLFKPDNGNCLFHVEINGVAVSQEKLVEIADKGLRLSHVQQDMSIVATFASGSYLYIQTGENVKNAYLTRTVNGTIEKYYNGQCIPSPGRFTVSASFTLCVEVLADENGYTYILDDADFYTFQGNGLYVRNPLILTSKNSIYRVSIGSAQKYPIMPVDVTYSVPEYVTEHYISSNPSATQGDANATYMTGQVVYIFVKRPAGTAEYNYSAPSGFSAVNSMIVSPNASWYRRAVCVIPGQSHFEVSLERTKRTYTVSWNNWDGAPLDSQTYPYGDTPIYDQGKSIPVKPDDETHSFIFTGWSPVVSPVTGNVTYIAQFTPVLRYDVAVNTTMGGSVFAPGNIYSITCEETKTYTFTPDVGYLVKDVQINGVSIGAAESYTFSNVAAPQSINVEFEKITFAVNVTYQGSGTITPVGQLTVGYGEDLIIRISPDEGHFIYAITVDGNPVDPTERLAILDVTDSHTIEIVLKQNPPSFWVIMTIFTLSAVVLGVVIFLSIRAKHRRKNRWKEYYKKLHPYY